MNPHKVDAVGLLSALLVLTASYFALFRGTSTELSGLLERAHEMKLKAGERYALLADLEAAHATLQPLRQTVQEATASFAMPADADRFLHQLATAARQCNVELNLLRPGARTEGEDSEYLPISIIAQAPFPRLHQFFSELEQASQLTTIETMSITSNLERADCKAELTIHLYLPRSNRRT